MAPFDECTAVHSRAELPAKWARPAPELAAEDPSRSFTPFSHRASLPSKETPKYLPEFFTEVIPNPWSEKNPNGVVNLGVAENRACQETLQNRFMQVKVDVPGPWMGYNDVSGMPELRQAFADVLEKHVFQNGVKVDPNLLVVSNGCTSTISMLARIFSDGVLLPTKQPAKTTTKGCFAGLASFFADKAGLTIAEKAVQPKMMYAGPRYPGFRMDFKGLAGVDPVQAYSGDPRRLPNEAELDAALAREPSVCAFVVCNPENPTGISYSQDELMCLVRWCRKNRIYLISDEIYGASCWHEERQDGSWRPLFSLMEFADVTVWGLSKDFGSSGARTSVAYIPHKPLLNAVKSFNILHALPNVAQVVLADVLGDAKFMDAYMPQCRDAMRANASIIKASLGEMKVPFVESDGAMFIWIDFKEFKIPAMELFRVLLKEYQVFLTPGTEFFEGGLEPDGSQVYWMRACFGACGGQKGLQEGMKKLAKFVNDKRSASNS
mmetsp:Transcript_93559/g.195038  ORF Transcript_93559/g.195038 Transcript_93559/m.195038 type:complete len:493 (+) Transcript_93559:123-1601(+)